MRGIVGRKSETAQANVAPDVRVFVAPRRYIQLAKLSPVPVPAGVR
jgi:hypothetical protein